jgi:hypothetical protein
MRSHHHGGHPAPPPGQLKRLAFCATFTASQALPPANVLGLGIVTVLGWEKLETIALAVGRAIVFGYAFTMVRLFRGGMACRSTARVELAAATAPIAIMERAFELQTVCTPAAPDSDAIASTTALNTSPATVPETNPAPVELHHKALAARRQADIATSPTQCGVFRKRDAVKGCRIRDRATPTAPCDETLEQKKLDLPSVANLINATGATSAQ